MFHFIFVIRKPVTPGRRETARFRPAARSAHTWHIPDALLVVYVVRLYPPRRLWVVATHSVGVKMLTLFRVMKSGQAESTIGYLGIL